MNNKKFIRNLIIGIVVIALLVVLLVLAYKMPEKNDGDVDNSDTNYSDITEAVSVLSLEADDVKSITVENEFGSYTVENNGDDGFSMKNGGAVPYSSSLLSTNFSAFLSISAQKDVTGEEVGFSETAKATLTMKDGSEKVVVLGNEVIGENQYFLQYDSKQYVVLSYVSSAFLSKPDDFRETSLTSISSDFKTMTIKQNGQDYVTLKAVEDEEESNILDVGVSYILTYPQKMAADEDKLTPFFELLGDGYTVGVESFVDNNIANKSKYNIGKKAVNFSFDDGSVTLYFGDKDEDGNVYTVLNDEKYIFTMKSDLFDIIDSYSPDVLMNKMAHLVLITKIDQVVFEGNKKKYTLDISGKEDNYTYKINGKKIDEDVFKDVYQEIIGITVDKMADKVVKGGKAEYTVTFRYLDKSKVTYSYVSYDSRNYVLQKDGEGEKILLKKRLPTAMENIEKLLK